MPEPRRTRSRWRRPAILVSVASFVVPPVGALGPGQLLENMGEWAQLLSVRSYVFIAWGLGIVGITAFGVIMIRTKVKARSWIDYLAPQVRHGVPEQVPRQIEQRVIHILDVVTGSEDQGSHELRLVILTGQYTLNYLRNIIRTYQTRHRWTIRVLLLDPDAQEVELMADGTQANIFASLAQLVRMKDAAKEEGWPLDLMWKGYTHLLPMRGYLFDEDHLLLGLTAWSKVDLGTDRVVAPELHTQGRKLAYLTRRDELGRDAIDTFKTWFDYVWKHRSVDLEATP